MYYETRSTGLEQSENNNTSAFSESNLLRFLGSISYSTLEYDFGILLWVEVY